MDKNIKKRIVKKEETKNNVIVPIIPKIKDDLKGAERLNARSDHIIIDGKKHLYEPDEEFKSCCFSCDKPLCLYIGKYTISLLVLVFCFLMLQNKENSAEFYTGTIAGLLGHYLNSPIAQTTSKDNKKDKE